MRRREFITLVSGAAAWPLVANAQKKPARIGFLGAGGATGMAIFVEALKDGLRENGLQEGRDYVFDFGWAEGDYDKFPALAEAMVKNNDAIIVATTISAVRAAQLASNKIPIVMASIIDPVGAKLVESLARPGGNTTGMANLAEDVNTKLVELMQDLLPKVNKAGVLLNPANPLNPVILAKLEKLLGAQAVQVYPAETRSRQEFDSAFAALERERPGALFIMPDFLLLDARERIAALALRYRIPVITNQPEYTDAGALISYGPSRRAVYRRSAYYVKRILDGANPADLPVEQPTQMELSINLKTAKELGISIPYGFLSRADRVVE
jgi:putative tryptophan/tyrosine transport system substrate-binding protein